MGPPLQRRRIGLLGGSFNPPHLGHLLSSVYWLESAGLDAVWWLPVHRHAFAKDAGLLPFEERLAMCREALLPWPRIEVDPIESQLAAPSRTLLTVLALRERHPDADFAWIIGSDLLEELPHWYRWPELRDGLRFLVIGRDGHRPPLPEGGDFVLRDLVLPDISSSAIRAALARGEDASAWLPAGTRRWLARNPGRYR